ncbi:hypothetical protein RM704_35845 [Streptomyces sp. DSM 3412]|uniref:Uncharacterized protein n=1 Tax=Streptomyces gottesmaniae TaxID=3075518 RepID=A0ABU2Z8S2_9ACTN|nr:hypothetical protein [Streptomyces sp. DSM 3412]MDT0572776.1 hypothetical protein [Streptomyces sp. DSM 3412]
MSPYDPAHSPESIALLGMQVGRAYLVTAQTLSTNEVPTPLRRPGLIHGSDEAINPPSRSEDYISHFRDGELRLFTEQDDVFSQNPGRPAGLVATFVTAHLR